MKWNKYTNQHHILCCQQVILVQCNCKNKLKYENAIYKTWAKPSQANPSQAKRKNSNHTNIPNTNTRTHSPCIAPSRLFHRFPSHNAYFFVQLFSGFLIYSYITHTHTHSFNLERKCIEKVPYAIERKPFLATFSFPSDICAEFLVVASSTEHQPENQYFFIYYDADKARLSIKWKKEIFTVQFVLLRVSKCCISLRNQFFAKEEKNRIANRIFRSKIGNQHSSVHAKWNSSSEIILKLLWWELFFFVAFYLSWLNETKTIIV